MSYRITEHLPAWQVLTVTADSSSSGNVRRLGGDYPIHTIAASSSLSLGPFAEDRQFEIVSDSGLLTFAIAAQDQESDVPATAEDVANKSTNVSTDGTSDTKYPSCKAVKSYADTKQASLGFTAENSANKSTNVSTDGASDTKYPSVKAVKSYADTSISNLGLGTASTHAATDFDAAGSADFLASNKLDTSGASLTISSLPARDFLRVFIRVWDYAQTDTVSLQFNGDTGANYNHRWLYIPAGSTTFTEDSTASDTLIELAGQDVTTGRVIEVQINNLATKEKICRINTATGTGSAATLPYLEIGMGTWVNTSDQINSIKIVTAGGHLFRADMAVYGRNF